MISFEEFFHIVNEQEPFLWQTELANMITKDQSIEGEKKDKNKK